jgi:hypothetical protein
MPAKANPSIPNMPMGYGTTDLILMVSSTEAQGTGAVAVLRTKNWDNRIDTKVVATYNSKAVDRAPESLAQAIEVLLERTEAEFKRGVC